MVNEMMGEGLIFKALNVRSPQFLHLVSKAHLWKSFGFLVQAIKPEVAYSTRNAERNKKMLNAKKVGGKVSDRDCGWKWTKYAVKHCCLMGIIQEATSHHPQVGTLTQNFDLILMNE